ncbi:histone acetyltransferases subunit 3-domain-containing protein [Sporodiniella umbellata]|nr:histone acetyltransferases subunit 3-domain-containing protein [Sporodiniella umbellata]
MKRKVEPEDFARVKSKDQVPLTTFWAAIDPCFRPLTEQDRDFLLQISDKKPFLIPPLGEHYSQRWKREDKLLQLSPKEVTQPLSCTSSLSDRLFASLVTEDLLDEMPDIQNGEETEDITMNADAVDFEERLKEELCYAGLLEGYKEELNTRENDEICAELRALGKEYQEQTVVNEIRKKKLLEVVDQQLQFEQYRRVLQALDRQVEQGYLKINRNQKSKKNAVKSESSILSENTASAANKRKTWINALGEIFKDRNLDMPSKTIYPFTEDC